MSERTRGEGNADAPKVDENEVRSGDGHAETGPRRVGDSCRDHEEDRKRRESELGTSWTTATSAGSLQ